MKNLMQSIKTSLINLPSPSNIHSLWNLGFMLGVMLMTQMMTGILLSFHYLPHASTALYSMNLINWDINQGWFIQLLHMNGVSLFFLLIFIHMARGIYFKSFVLKSTWFSGLLLFFLLMITAFLGYILPWGQMSFWGATVISNLFSALPYIGENLVQWVWGGYSVNSPTLNRFYSLHFLCPFILLAFMTLHLIFLHDSGSSNPLGINSNNDKSPFYPYFFIKDMNITFIMISILILILLFYPLLLSDPENFNPANPLITPIHIQPEWYFLFAYAILRSIPNKLGGVMALISSILILLFLSKSNPQYLINNFIHLLVFYLFTSSFIILTWVGMNPVETPFIFIGQSYSILYFSSILIMIL